MIRLQAEDTKEGRAKTVPIGGKAYKQLKSIIRRIDKHQVILYNGRSISRSIRTSLMDACDKAGIIYGREVKGGFIFHDLRGTFITDMEEARVSKIVVMTITGHQPKDMNERYKYERINKNDALKLEAVRQLEAFREVKKQNGDHIGDQEKLTI